MKIIGIAGASGSGKSTFAKELSLRVLLPDVSIVSIDSFYKEFDEDILNIKHNFDSPESIDFTLFISVLNQLQNNIDVFIPDYNFKTFKREGKIKINRSPIVILEGHLLFTKIEVFEKIDIKIFIDTPLDICLIRRILRDTKERGRTLDSVLNQYMSTVRESYLNYIHPTMFYPDVQIISGEYDFLESHFDDIVKKIDLLV